MDDNVEINELVHTISLLRRTQEYNPARPSHSAPKLKHLNLLDGIALLIVMGDKSDVVAVTYRQTATNLTLFYSANRPNPNRRVHIEQIADTIRNIVPNQRVKTPATDILCFCLEPCSRKIKQRIKKLWKASKDLMEWNLNKDSLETFVRSICSPGSGYQLALKFFILLQQTSDDASGSMQDDSATIDILCRSYYLAMKTPGICATPMFATLKRRIRKLGDYFGAARRLCAICATPDVNKYLKHLHLQEIVPPPPQKQPVRNPLIVMNSYKSATDPTITDADFRLAFAEILLPIKPTMITISQHCEISIALGIPAGFSLSEPFTEIGISKHSCWLCEVFLRCLESKSGHKFVVTGYQGKVHAGWHYPIEAGEDIRNSLLETLLKELGELRGMADPRRRSDSFPVSSPEADEEQFGSEEEMTKEEIDERLASTAAKRTRPALDEQNL